jgi:hypothetical protein
MERELMIAVIKSFKGAQPGRQVEQQLAVCL